MSKKTKHEHQKLKQESIKQIMAKKDFQNLKNRAFKVNLKFFRKTYDYEVVGNPDLRIVVIPSLWKGDFYVHIENKLLHTASSHLASREEMLDILGKQFQDNDHKSNFVWGWKKRFLR